MIEIYKKTVVIQNCYGIGMIRLYYPSMSNVQNFMYNI